MRGMARRGFVTGAAGAVAGAAGAAAVAGDAVARPRRVRALPGPAAGRDVVRRELRGMWVATVANTDWPSRPGLSAAAQRAELTAHLDRAVERKLNAVILQVRPTADALWPSAYEPWAEYLTGTQGKDPGWDPLGTAVREAHDRGLELHAWFNPYRVANHTDPGRLTASHPARRNPGWVLPYGGKLYYNPGLPEVRAFVQDAMLDAVRRYDIDAVHWDDYFYPYPVAGQSFADGAAYEVRRRLPRPGRLAPRQHGPAGPRDGRTPQGAEARRPVRHQPLRRLAQRGHGPGGLADPGRGADVRRPVRGHPRLDQEGLAGLRRPAAVLAHRQRGGRLRGPGAVVVRHGTGDGRRPVHRGGPVQVRRPGPARGLAGPGGAVRHIDLAAGHDQVRGHAYFSANSVAADRIGAMDRVVADHYRTRARPPR